MVALNKHANIETRLKQCHLKVGLKSGGEDAECFECINLHYFSQISCFSKGAVDSDPPHWLWPFSSLDLWLNSLSCSLVLIWVNHGPNISSRFAGQIFDTENHITAMLNPATGEWWKTKVMGSAHKGVCVGVGVCVCLISIAVGSLCHVCEDLWSPLVMLDPVNLL